MNCTCCSSSNTIKYGKTRKNKQLWFCKNCSKRFYEKVKEKNLRYDPRIITFSLDLYFSGLSLRKVARSLNDHFDLNMDHSTIYYWIKKYIPRITEAMNDLIINNKMKIHIDEIFIKTRNEDKKIAYLWNIMDRETRFMLASEISTDRTTQAAIYALKQAIRQMKYDPSVIVTDDYKAYFSALKMKEFRDIPHEHGTLTHAHNNIIERLNGTCREKFKVMRGFKTSDSVIPHGMMMQYNYIRPHQSLDDKTPAETIGAAKEKMTWDDIFKQCDIF